MFSAVRCSLAAATMTLGCPLATSVAKLGPEMTPLAWLSRKTESTTAVMVAPVCSSIPLLAVTTRAWLSRCGRAISTVSRMAWEGTTKTTRRASLSASPMSTVAVRPAGREMPGK